MISLPKKVRNSILLGYSIPFVILVVLSGLTLGQISSQIGINREKDRVKAVEKTAQDTRYAIAQLVRTARGQVLFPKDTFYQDYYDKGIEDYEKSKDETQEDLKDQQQIKNWETFIQEADKLQSLSDQVMSLAKSGKQQEAIKLTGELKMADLEDMYEKFYNREEELLKEVVNREKTSETILITVVIGGSLLGIGLMGGFGYVITEGITRQLRKSANDISSASAEIATTMEQQERTSNQQAASVNETTTTMDELGASSRTSEEQAEAASKSASEVLELARRGNLAVEETVATMLDLKGKVSAIADQTVRLSEQTTLIGNISDLVSDLAQQTNMLALNASVEAVRAGEHGQGFAIVAEEIRKLAEGSKQSASKISTLVSDIQNAINTTVMVTDEGTKTVNAGMNVTEKTAQALGGVVEAVNNVAMNSQQIALNIRQQSRAVQQVLAAMDSINQGAQQSATGITQIKTGTHQLNKTAQELQEIV